MSLSLTSHVRLKPDRINKFKGIEPLLVLSQKKKTFPTWHNSLKCVLQDCWYYSYCFFLGVGFFWNPDQLINIDLHLQKSGIPLREMIDFASEMNAAAFIYYILHGDLCGWNLSTVYSESVML